MEWGSVLGFGDRHVAVTSQPAVPLPPTPPASVLEGEPAALAYRPRRGAVQFNVPLHALAAAQAVAQPYGISVAGLYRLALAIDDALGVRDACGKRSSVLLATALAADWDGLRGAFR